VKDKESSISILLIAIDQLSKLLVVSVGFPVVYNRGIAFSLLGGINPIFIALILIVLARSYRNNFWFGFIIAGGAANLIDRIRLGYVIDFINLGFWPVFNLADVFITIGVLAIIIVNMKEKYESNY